MGISERARALGTRFGVGWLLPPADERRPGFGLRMVSGSLFLLLSSTYWGIYLQTGHPVITALVAFALELASLRAMLARPPARQLFAWLALPSLLFAGSVVLGYHIHVENGYAGIITQNYVRPFSLADLFALVFLAAGSSLVFYGALELLRSAAARAKGRGPDLSAVGVGWILALTLSLCVMWLPYLLTYFPGLVYYDTLQSLRQAFGWEQLNNHHPVVYTLFIRTCIRLAEALGRDAETGVVLYVVAQMVFTAWSLAYACCWARRRCGLHFAVLLLAGFILGTNSYLATFAISMWKDPVFSAALAALSCMLADLALTRGRVAQSPRWLAGYLALALVGALWRNNGVYALVLVGVCLAMLWWRKRSQAGVRGYALAALATAAVVAFSLVLTGPIYRSLNVIEEPVEAVGVPLNQMARVVAGNGRMSEDDRKYMNMLLPLGNYFGTYRPCTVDTIKWSPLFHAEALNNNFLGHWWSLLVKNPKLYLEGWMLLTHGFWTVNCPHVNRTDYNVSQGGVVNSSSFDPTPLSNTPLWSCNLLKQGAATQIFPTVSWSIPEGWILWAIVFLLFALLVRRRPSWGVALMPSLGLMLTLAVASPIWYWPRYGALLQMLIPLYLALLWLTFCPWEVRAEAELAAGGATTQGEAPLAGEQLAVLAGVHAANP